MFKRRRRNAEFKRRLEILAVQKSRNNSARKGFEFPQKAVVEREGAKGYDQAYEIR